MYVVKSKNIPNSIQFQIYSPRKYNFFSNWRFTSQINFPYFVCAHLLGESIKIGLWARVLIVKSKSQYAGAVFAYYTRIFLQSYYSDDRETHHKCWLGLLVRAISSIRRNWRHRCGWSRFPRIRPTLRSEHHLKINFWPILEEHKNLCMWCRGRRGKAGGRRRWCIPPCGHSMWGSRLSHQLKCFNLLGNSQQKFIYHSLITRRRWCSGSPLSWIENMRPPAFHFKLKYSLYAYFMN